MTISSRIPSSKLSRLLSKQCGKPILCRINLLSCKELPNLIAFKQHLTTTTTTTTTRQISNVSFSSEGFQGIPSAYKVYKDHRSDRYNYNGHKRISPYAMNNGDHDDDNENDVEENTSHSTNYPKGKRFYKHSGAQHHQQQRDISQNSPYFLSNRDSSSSLSSSPTSSWSKNMDQDDSVRSKDMSFQKHRSNKISISRSVMKKIQRLDHLQKELEHWMNIYREQMGVDSMDMEEKTMIIPAMDDTHKVMHLQEKLLETEEIYRKICIVLRQIIAGWSWMKPIPRHYTTADLWQNDQEENSLPPINAVKYLNILECIRKQRDELICLCRQQQEQEKRKINHLHGHSSSEKSSTNLVKWFKDKFAMTYQEDKHESLKHENSQISEQMKLGDLIAHKSIDFTANVRLYHAVLNCVCQWRHMSLKSDEISAESIFATMKNNYEGGNPNAKPDLKIYHRMIEYYKESETLVDVMKGVELLKEMIKLREKDANHDLDVSESIHDVNFDSCRPTIATFTLVVSSFHGIGSTAEVKVQALDAADDVLNIMEELYSSNGAISSIRSGKELPSVSDNQNLIKEGSTTRLELCEPYRAMLQNLIAVGPKLLGDYKIRVDDIMERLLGKHSYEKLIIDDDSLIDRKSLDHLLLHDLIHALAITNEKSHIKKAKVILKKMEIMRDVALSQSTTTRTGAKPWPLNYPLPNSYKSIILGILHSSIDVDDETSVRKVATVEDAIYATELLDTILMTKPSMRNVYSCYRVIRLWGATDSEDAGRKGEEILGKMMKGLLINKDQHLVTDLVLRAKQSTLENWSVAAAAGAPGAASNAFNLMERMHERLMEENVNDDRRRKEMAYFYIAVIRACAETVLEHEKEQALDIALQTYNKMIEESVILSPFLFVQLMKCCQLASSSSHDKAIKLSKEVFQAACMNGLVNRHVLFVLKQVNCHLFESYEKKPEHSANVKKVIHLDE